MLTLAGTIRDYDSSTDSASVELTGAGVLDTWLDGVSIAPTINRAFIAAGAPLSLALPDAHRLCEARIISVTPPTVLNANARTQQGRGTFSTNNLGYESTTVTFATPYTSAPSVSAALDNLQPCTISAVSTTGFTISNPNPLSVNALIYFSWSAVGV